LGFAAGAAVAGGRVGGQSPGLVDDGGGFPLQATGGVGFAGLGDGQFVGQGFAGRFGLQAMGGGLVGVVQHGRGDSRVRSGDRLDDRERPSFLAVGGSDTAPLYGLAPSSVSCYSGAFGRPGLLGGGDVEGLRSGSPLGRFRLPPSRLSVPLWLLLAVASVGSRTAHQLGKRSGDALQGRVLLPEGGGLDNDFGPAGGRILEARAQTDGRGCEGVQVAGRTLAEQLAEPFRQGTIRSRLSFETILGGAGGGQPSFYADAFVGSPSFVIETPVDGSGPDNTFGHTVDVAASAEGDDAANIEARRAYCLPGVFDPLGIGDDDPPGQCGVGGEKAGPFVGIVPFGQPAPPRRRRDPPVGENVPYLGDVVGLRQQTAVAERVERELIGAGGDGKLPQLRLRRGDRLPERLVQVWAPSPKIDDRLPDDCGKSILVGQGRRQGAEPAVLGFGFV
jgi:hypothetical protein